MRKPKLFDPFIAVRSAQLHNVQKLTYIINHFDKRAISVHAHIVYFPILLNCILSFFNFLLEMCLISVRSHYFISHSNWGFPLWTSGMKWVASGSGNFSGNLSIAHKPPHFKFSWDSSVGIAKLRAGRLRKWDSVLRRGKRFFPFL
jgi:hypothetical protein